MMLCYLPFAEIREVKHGDRSGIYWLGSYPFPLAKRDVSFITVEQWSCLTRNSVALEKLWCAVYYVEMSLCMNSHKSCQPVTSYWTLFLFWHYSGSMRSYVDVNVRLVECLVCGQSTSVNIILQFVVNVVIFQNFATILRCQFLTEVISYASVRTLSVTVKHVIITSSHIYDFGI